MHQTPVGPLGVPELNTSFNPILIGFTINFDQFHSIHFKDSRSIMYIIIILFTCQYVVNNFMCSTADFPEPGFDHAQVRGQRCQGTKQLLIGRQAILGIYNFSNGLNKTWIEYANCLCLQCGFQNPDPDSCESNLNKEIHAFRSSISQRTRKGG